MNPTIWIVGSSEHSTLTVSSNPGSSLFGVSVDTILSVVLLFAVFLACPQYVIMITTCICISDLLVGYWATRLRSVAIPVPLEGK